MANPTNVLSSGIEITGSIRFSTDMIIDGKIEGEITSDKGRVTIGENAVIKGDVTAGEAKVYGLRTLRIEGQIPDQRRHQIQGLFHGGRRPTLRPHRNRRLNSSQGSGDFPQSP